MSSVLLDNVQDRNFVKQPMNKFVSKFLTNMQYDIIKIF